MTTNPLKKNKVVLSDYPFENDIKYRLKLAELSSFEVELINAILDSSLSISIIDLLDELNTNFTELLLTLKKLEGLDLYKINDTTLIVDKDMRKYYELQFSKFDDSFHGDLEFLRGILNKVPIHVLPNWYAIPRTSDDIFESIIEKHFHKPKLYEKYIEELVFDDPIVNEIKEALFSSPNLKLKAKDLIAKYNISREKFEEYALLLEFNLISFLSYNQEDDHWEEVITPFEEWQQYLNFLRNNAPTSIKDTENIIKTHPHDFGFLEDLTRFLGQALKNPIRLDNATPYQMQIAERAAQLKLGEIDHNAFHAKETARIWIEKPLMEQSIYLFRYSTAPNSHVGIGNVNKDLLEIEKALVPFKNHGWMYLDSFIKVSNAAIGDNLPVTLEKKGRRWYYVFPQYSQADIQSTRYYIFNILFETGFITTGTHNGKECFCLTPFGKASIT